MFLVQVYFMQYVHKVKGKDLIKREGRKTGVSLTCFNMGLAEIHCLLHNTEETQVYCVQKIQRLSKERNKRKLLTA